MHLVNLETPHLYASIQYNRGKKQAPLFSKRKKIIIFCKMVKKT